MKKSLDLNKFDLKKVKASQKGLSAEWFDLNSTNELFSVESDSTPSEDLFNCMNELKEFFANSLGITTGWDFARDHVKANEERLKEAIRCRAEQLDRINITGVVFVGSGESEGIKITGSLKCGNGTVGLSSVALRFNEEDEFNGDELKAVCDKITVEAWYFIFKGKRGHDLFTGLEDEEPEFPKSGLNVMQKVS